jgi:hypothetical protein
MGCRPTEEEWANRPSLHERERSWNAGAPAGGPPASQHRRRFTANLMGDASLVL